MDKPTIATLFAEAGKQLRADFEHVRSTMPHAGLKGEEVEGILRTFLDRHLPQRFGAGSGLIIDSENNLSKQMDFIVYDALSSPLYRFAERAQIIPADSVASAIQVKTALNKRELEDAYENIASSKRLKKRPLSDIDRKSTGSAFSTLATFGVVFGFDADASMEALAMNAAELNAKYDSNLWPDLIVVLDQGAISYAISFPGETEMAALLQPPGDDEFIIPPAYVHLFILSDKEFALNRFFLMLLSHLTFYPYRASTPPFDVMMGGSSSTGKNVTAYQYNRTRLLRPVPEDEYMDKPSWRTVRTRELPRPPAISERSLCAAARMPTPPTSWFSLWTQKKLSASRRRPENGPWGSWILHSRGGVAVLQATPAGFASVDRCGLCRWDVKTLSDPRASQIDFSPVARTTTQPCRQATDKPTGQRPLSSPVPDRDRGDSGPLKTSANLRFLRLVSLLILPRDS
jgi:uncharacterized protein DUF6602